MIVENLKELSLMYLIDYLVVVSQKAYLQRYLARHPQNILAEKDGAEIRLEIFNRLKDYPELLKGNPNDPT